MFFSFVPGISHHSWEEMRKHQSPQLSWDRFESSLRLEAKTNNMSCELAMHKSRPRGRQKGQLKISGIWRAEGER